MDRSVTWVLLTLCEHEPCCEPREPLVRNAVLLSSCPCPCSYVFTSHCRDSILYCTILYCTEDRSDMWSFIHEQTPRYRSPSLNSLLYPWLPTTHLLRYLSMYFTTPYSSVLYTETPSSELRSTVQIPFATCYLYFRTFSLSCRSAKHLLTYRQGNIP